MERLRSALRPAQPQAASGRLRYRIEAVRAEFIRTMENDFNTSGALAALYELVRVINQARADGASADALGLAQGLLRELAGVLGLRLEKTDKAGAAGPFIELLIQLRSELRQQKLYALADQVRQRLTDLGVVLEDSKEGTTWRWQ